MTPATPADVARSFMTAIHQARHYGPDHPTARAAAARLREVIGAEIARASCMRMEAGPHWLKVQSAVLPVEERYAGQAVAHLEARRIRAITAQQGTTAEEIGALIRLLALAPEVLVAEGGLADGLQSAGATHLAIETVDAVVPPLADDGAAGDPIAEAVVAMDTITGEVEQGDPVDVARAHQAAESVVYAMARDRAAVIRPLVHRGHDELDPMHPVATCVLTLLAADALDLSVRDRAELGAAALLHDIGLVVLPWPQRSQERATQSPQPSWRHPAEGAYLLREAAGGGNLPMIVAMEHHLPASNTAAGVLPHSRLVALADYVDAMTSARTPGLRRAAPQPLLAQLLGGEGPRFDPVHVRALAAVLRDAAAGGIDLSGGL